MLSQFKLNKHQRYLAQLPKLPQSAADVTTLFTPAEFHQTLLKAIASATQRSCITSLYLENDDGGRSILSALYQAKSARMQLDVSVFVDWHRAQRGRIGVTNTATNADWYCEIASQHPDITIPVYGIPV